MTKPHIAAIISAAAIGAFLLFGILFGRMPMPVFFGSDHTVRETCIALWAFLLPGWFLIEEMWAPDDDAALKMFRKAQQSGKQFWTVAGGAVAIIIGLSSPADHNQSAPEPAPAQAKFSN